MELRDTIAKFVLCAAAIALFPFSVWAGYLLIGRIANGQTASPLWGTSLVWGAVAFTAAVVVLLAAVALLRTPQYMETRPSFKLVLLVALIALVACTFAGVQPLASYKDRVWNTVAGRLAETFSGMSGCSPTPEETP